MIISRAEAHAKGLKHFYTGKLCKYGHDSPRFVTTSGCVKCGVLRSRQFASTEKNKAGKFIYPLRNPADYEKAWAYCQALDIGSGFPPTIKDAPRPPEEPFVLPAHIAEKLAFGYPDGNMPQMQPHGPGELPGIARKGKR